MKIHDDPAVFRIKALSRMYIADLPDDLSGRVLVIDLGIRCDLSEDMYQIGAGRNLTGDMRFRILLQNTVQDPVRDLVADLVRVASCYGFRGKNTPCIIE